MRSDLASVGKKVDAHAILIKHLEFQMAQLSSSVNSRHSGTIPSNIVENLINDGHCMIVTTQGGKRTIDPLMLSCVENVIRGDDEVVDVSLELEGNMGKEDEVTQKLTPVSRLPPPFQQRLVKTTEDGKYLRFITMLKQLSINIFMIKALERIPGYDKLMKDMDAKKRSVSFEDHDRI